MTASAHDHLRLVDVQTGEVVSSCPQCSELEDQISGLQRDIRGWAARYAELRRDKDAEARKSPRWPIALRVFQAWQELCRHPRAIWDVSRFEAAEPYLKRYGEELCLRAVAGIAFDPFITTRKNGSKKRHDGWDLLFRNPDKFEEFANRAPQDWQPPGSRNEVEPPADGTVASERLAQGNLAM